MNVEYQKFLNKCMLEFIHKILLKIQTEKSYIDQPLYISYRTNHPLVSLSTRIKERYPEEITIVIQYQFEDLMVKSDGFFVTVSFDKIKEVLYVPFDSLISFIDSMSGFSLQFKFQHGLLNEKKMQQSTISNNIETSDNLPQNVIFLDKFRTP